MARSLANVIGFDDAPFDRNHRGDVLLVGVVCSRTRLDGIVSGKIRKDGANSTTRMIELVQSSQFEGHIRAVLLQGIAVGGFNVVDIDRLHQELAVPVLVVSRRPADLPAMRRSLFSRGIGSKRKWDLIQRAGEQEPLGPVYGQRRGLSKVEALDLLRATTLHGHLPEALRMAHLIAGGVTTGKSRGRA